MTVITKNSIKCNKCGDVLISKQRNKVMKCSCGECTCDGGIYYLKHTGDYTELSETEERPDPE
ncbi:MAG: hypothetical protein IKQ71_01590 [Lachnospiraceae bacterium]|nr:hypothetical protein [Lachnospiraceae bacterium]